MDTIRDHTTQDEPAPPFMSVAETARRLGRSVPRVYQLINAGKLPATRFAGRIVVPRSAFDAWLRMHDEMALANVRPIPTDAEGAAATPRPLADRAEGPAHATG